MPPAYVKPYVKRGKNDAADAEAICEAVTRPTMRFVAVKSREEQSAASLHRARSLLVGQRTQLVNMIRATLAESGIAIPEGVKKALSMGRQIVEREIDLGLSTKATMVVAMLSQQTLDTLVRLRNSTAHTNGSVLTIAKLCPSALDKPI
jgi:transposase